MARLSTLSPRFIGVYRWPPGPANPPISEAGLVFAWQAQRREEIVVRFATALDGTSVPAKAHGVDLRTARTGSDFETITLGRPLPFTGGTLTVTGGEVTDLPALGGRRG